MNVKCIKVDGQKYRICYIWLPSNHQVIKQCEKNINTLTLICAIIELNKYIHGKIEFKNMSSSKTSLGLEKKIIDTIDFNKAIDRIITDTKTDFIFAPHIKLIYEYGHEDLVELLTNNLEKYSFECSLPITLDVPKKSLLSRPGSILMPLDRLLYQIIVDRAVQKIEDNIDRDHVFSNVYEDSKDMFENHSQSYEEFQKYKCKATEKYEYCLKMDIASYFESINQHFLINLLNSLEIEKTIVRLLEKSLSSWSQMNSYSIIQGHFSSDILGNFYLTNFDYFFKIKDYDYCRFVDDIYVFSNDKIELHKLLIKVCNKLRKQGLFLNESKTKIMNSKDILIQETEFDSMFNDINEMLNEVFEDDPDFLEANYGFQVEWDDITENEEVEGIEGLKLDLIENFYSIRNEAKWQRDDIVKYCIPLFARAHSCYPIDTIKEEIRTYPYLIKYYSSYLATIDRENEDITKIIEKLLLSNHLIYDYQYLWLFSSLLYRSKVSSEMIDFAVKQLSDKQNHETIRSICSILISKFGSGAQRRTLRDEYENEPSYFVKSGILYGTRYLSRDERKACQRAWSGHSELNSLIISSLAKYNESKNSK